MTIIITSHIRGFTMDNSGQDPMHSDLPTLSRFLHGSDHWHEEWRQKPRLTVRELAMMGLTNFLTDISGRYAEVFDDQIVASWHDMAMEKKLISEKTWNWCLAELLDKARLFETTNSVMVLDTGARICKSDTTVRPELHAQLKEAIEILTTLFYEQNRPSLFR